MYMYNSIIAWIYPSFPNLSILSFSFLLVDKIHTNLRFMKIFSNLHHLICPVSYALGSASENCTVGHPKTFYKCIRYFWCVRGGEGEIQYCVLHSVTDHLRYGMCFTLTVYHTIQYFIKKHCGNNQFILFQYCFQKLFLQIL